MSSQATQTSVVDVSLFPFTSRARALNSEYFGEAEIKFQTGSSYQFLSLLPEH